MKEITELIGFLGDLGHYWNIYVELCKGNPVLAIGIAIPIVIFLTYVAFTQILGIAKKIKSWYSSRTGKLVIVLVVILASLGSLSIVIVIRESMAPIPKLQGPALVIGKFAVLNWEYDSQDKGSRLFYEVQSAEDQQFGRDLFVEPNLAQGKLTLINRNINGPRFWRVRAVQPPTNEDPSGKLKPKPVSRWSNVIQVSQFENTYERILRTKRVNVYTSDSFNQGFFAFMSGGQPSGFDIELAKLIVERLPKRMGVTFSIEPHIKSVAWGDLLETPGKGDADLIIASITKRPEREEIFGIVFSQPYYRTSLSLIFRVGTEVNEIRDAIKGRRIGVQDKTTSEFIAHELKKEYSGKDQLTVRMFGQDAEAIDRLQGAHPELDYVIADTPFAKASQIITRSNNTNVLEYKEFQTADFPKGISKDRFEEPYAIAVRSGESKLLGLINEILIELGPKELPALEIKMTRAYMDAVGKR